MLVEANEEEEEKIGVFPATFMVFPALAKWRVYATLVAALHNFEPAHMTGFRVHNGIQTKS